MSQAADNQRGEAGMGGELILQAPLGTEPLALPRSLARVLLFLSACAGYALTLWWLDRYALRVAPEAYFSLRTVASNAAVALPAVLVIWALSRRMWSSFLLVAAVQAATYLVSAKKLAILGSPVALQDFHFVTNFSWANVELLGAYLDRPFLVLLSLVSCLALVAGAFLLERPGFERTSLMRFGLGAMGIVLVLTLHSAAWPWRSAYTKETIRPSALSRTPETLRSGLMSSLAYRHLEASHRVFKEDVPALRSALAMMEGPGKARGVDARGPAAVDPTSAPDIVVILSESFMDPRVLKGMQEVPDVIPDVRALIERGRGSDMIVPTYGGGTVRTEFEVMTGMPVAAFPGVMYPYADITRRKMPGLVSVLKKQGYSAIAVHGNSGGFWNRTNTYRSMGMDRFVTASEFPGDDGEDGGWYSDKAMTDIVLEQLDKASGPTFVFAVSIENHGPYNKTLPVRNESARTALELPAGLEGEAELSWRNYLYHLGNADAQFARLIDAMRRRGRPFVVAMFGDHLPPLGETYDALGFVNGDSPRKQRVPWVIVDSRENGPLAAAKRHIRSWQLPAEVLDAAGVPGDAYFDFVREAGHRLDSAKGGGEREALESGIRAAAIARLEGRFEEYAGQ